MRMSARFASLTLLTCMLAHADTPKPATLEGHTNWVASVAFSPDGKYLVSGSADRTARTWDVATGKVVDVVKGHADYVSAVAYGGDGVVMGTYDGTVSVWSPGKKTQQLEKRRGAVLAVAVSKDNVIAAGGMDGIITLLSREGKELAKLTGHKTWVSSLAFRGEQLVSGSSDGTAKLWDTKTNKLVKSFALLDPREIRGVALSPDGKRIAAACRYGAVVVWDVGGKEIVSLDAHDGDAWSVAFTPDGKTLISGGGDWGKPSKVRLWEVATWKEKSSLDHPAEVLCVAVSPDGRRLAVGGAGKTVRLWELQAK